MIYKLLVAEDEPIERMVLCRTLRKNLGEFLEIHEAENGIEALELYRREQPQIVILDVEMPGISGLEAARRIRAEGGLCAVVFLTGFENFAYAKQAIEVRALDYLLKPYEEQELICAVEESIQYVRKLSELMALVPAEPPAEQEGEVTEIRLAALRNTVRSFIDERYTQPLSMQDAAKAMGYSETYFCRLFKQCFGVNFSTYLNEFRVEKAKEMMADTRTSIRQISTACGYSDPKYFARVFRRFVGLTPSEYRLHIMQNIQN